MDGNRRWARQQGLAAAFMGHTQGVEALKTAVQFCLKKDIRYLTVYTLSLENLNKRSAEEKKHIFGLLLKVLTNDQDELVKNQIRVQFIGERSTFPASLIPAIENIEKVTAPLHKLTLSILLCYGSQQELVSAARLLAEQAVQGNIKPGDINEETMNAALWTAGMPSPELIIRTGGAQRLSNFLLFQAAYSELIFLDCYWPEMTEAILEDCLVDYAGRQKNFGK